MSPRRGKTEPQIWWWDLPSGQVDRHVPLSSRVAAISLVASAIGLLLALVAQTVQAADVKLVYSGSLFSLGAVAIVAIWYLPGPWSPAANPVLRSATFLVVGLGLGMAALAWFAKIGPFTTSPQPIVLTGTTPVPLAAGQPVDLGAGRTISVAPEIETFGTAFAVRLIITNRTSEPIHLRIPDEDIFLLSSSGQRFPAQRPDQAASVGVGPHADSVIVYTVAGAIPATAAHLDVSLAGLINPPIQWRLPLAGIQHRGVVLAAYRAPDRLRIAVVVSNYGDRQIIVRYRDADVELWDDRGGRYELRYGDAPRMFAVGPGRTRSDSTEFKGPLDPRARSLRLTFKHLSGAENVRVDVPLQQSGEQS